MPAAIRYLKTFCLKLDCMMRVLEQYTHSRWPIIPNAFLLSLNIFTSCTETLLCSSLCSRNDRFHMLGCLQFYAYVTPTHLHASFILWTVDKLAKQKYGFHAPFSQNRPRVSLYAACKYECALTILSSALRTGYWCGKKWCRSVAELAPV